LSKPEKKKATSRQKPLKIDEKRLNELTIKFSGFSKKFHDLLSSDLQIHDKMIKIFEVVDSLESREERYVVFLLLLNMMITMTEQRTLIGLLEGFNDAARAACEDSGDDDDPDSGDQGSDTGDGGNGEIKK